MVDLLGGARHAVYQRAGNHLLDHIVGFQGRKWWPPTPRAWLVRSGSPNNMGVVAVRQAGMVGEAKIVEAVDRIKPFG